MNAYAVLKSDIERRVKELTTERNLKGGPGSGPRPGGGGGNPIREESQGMKNHHEALAKTHGNKEGEAHANAAALHDAAAQAHARVIELARGKDTSAAASALQTANKLSLEADKESNRLSYKSLNDDIDT